MSETDRESFAGAERYARLHALFDRMRELDPVQRRAYLDAHCDGESGLRRDVEELLAALEREDADAFSDEGIAAARDALEVVLPEDASPIDWLPEHIGRYRVLRRLGEGGMGVVYEAEQDAPRRRVAIKLLHPQQATPERLKRFRHEAELLGRLQHPGIAQIHEAGTYDLGRGEQPFFAMERVDGVAITTYAERAQLDVRGRLVLLARIADAVHHAHERGVIHRDLKPDNVLVDERGQPKVLDFGVARAAETSDVVSTLLTQEGTLLGTLAYMAPEQVTGQSAAISPRTDVYALGVIAFELLIGRLPHAIAGLPLTAAMKVLERLAHEDAKLIVESSGNAYINFLTSLGQSQGLLFASSVGGSADGGLVYNGNTDKMEFRTNGNVTRAVIDGSGNVGIGTTSPAKPLHVDSDISWPVRIEGSFNPGVNIDNTATGSSWAIYQSSTDNLNFRDSTTGVTRMIIDGNSGGVAIGNGDSAGPGTLFVNGTAFKPGGGSWSNSSDRRLKKDIEDLDGALDTLLALRGVTFEYKDPEAIGELAGERIGFIAQEVETVMPDWVHEAEGYKRLTIRGFEALAVEALRELEAENAELRDRVDQLESNASEMASLQAELATLPASLRNQVHRRTPGCQTVPVRKACRPGVRR